MSSISIEKRVISASAAHTAVAAAIAHGEKIGVSINAAVVDSSGILCAFLRMPESFTYSVSIAIDKAKTAAGFGAAPHELYSAIKDNRALELGLIRRDDCVLFGGGFPIYDGDMMIGGIGVSGATEEQDMECAEAGRQAVLALLSKA
ncbi:MAG: heme-binding protein [Porticoccaceae bacterium]|nr:heme-binding protein [Porticoccaceae bacterium]